MLLVCLTVTETVHSSTNADILERNQIFGINETGPYYPHVLLRDDEALIVGARNVVLNISLETLEENKRITWAPSLEDESACKEHRTTDQCQNYIRLLARKATNEILVCGTNAYRPSCRTFKTEQNETFIKDEEGGFNKVPYNPNYKSTFLYTKDQLFTATFADPNGKVPIIYSESPGLVMRSYLFDTQQETFISSFEYLDKVYFVFRERAPQHIDCRNAVFSMIARVCKTDRGGPHYFRNRWISYFKARLNCSIPGESPFYIDEVQATTELGKGNYRPSLLYSSRTDMFYAVFNTHQHAIPGSAVCAFRMRDILNSFEGLFRETRDTHSSQPFVLPRNIPTPHPGATCGNGSIPLSFETMKFIATHPLMHEAIPAYGGSPIITQVSFHSRMTTIAVDWQVKASDGKYYDILFLGTDDGHVIKSINRGAGTKIEPVTIEHIQVFTDKSPVTNLQIYKNDDVQKLVAIGRDVIKSIPLARCQIRVTCKQCVGLQDPYCSWNKEKDQCVQSISGIQSLGTGQHTLCTEAEQAKSQQPFSDNDTSTDDDGFLNNSKIPASCSDGYSLLEIGIVALLSFMSTLILAVIREIILCRWRTSSKTQTRGAMYSGKSLSATSQPNYCFC